MDKTDRNRVRLRAVEPEDAPAIAAMENDVTALDSTWLMAPLSVEQVRTYALTYDADPWRAGEIRFVIDCGGEVVGLADLTDIDSRNLRAELGLIVHRDWRRRGIALQAVEQLMAYAREWLHLRALTATISADNEASLRLFATVGFATLATLPAWLRRADGTFAAAHLLHRSL